MIGYGVGPGLSPAAKRMLEAGQRFAQARGAAAPTRPPIPPKPDATELALAEMKFLPPMEGFGLGLPLDCRLIQIEVARHYEITREDLIGPKRSQDLVRPRQVAMYLCRVHLPNRSLADIGKRFGDRDHTTVINAVARAEKMRAEGGGPARAIRMLDQRLAAYVREISSKHLPLPAGTLGDYLAGLLL